jgi:hypothetical protein
MRVHRKPLMIGCCGESQSCNPRCILLDGRPLDKGGTVALSFDAREWVKEWEKAIAANPAIPTDKETMVTWFANALMAGYDRRSGEVERLCDEIQVEAAS